MKTADKITAIRKALHLNQLQFAEPLGVGDKQISAIENNRANPSTSVLELMFVKYLVSRNWWETGEGEMFIKQGDGQPAPKVKNSTADVFK